MGVLRNAGPMALASMFVGVVPMAMGVLYAIWPSELRLTLIRTLTAATVFASISGAALGFINELRFIHTSHQRLEAIFHQPEVVFLRACGPVSLPNYRLVPDSRWHLDAPRGAIGARSAARHAHGVEVFALTRKGLRRLGFAAGASPTTNVPDPGYRRIAVNARFSAYAACPPAAP